MNQLLEWLSNLFGSWRFWVVVPAWDVGVRVRLGRNAVALAPGFHWRIPFVDEITLVNTRMRICRITPVTLSSGAGKVRNVAANVGYRISDPLKAVMAFEHPVSVVQAYGARSIAALKSEEIALADLQYALGEHGVEVEFITYVENVELRALRLMNDHHWINTPETIPCVNGVTRY